MSHPPTSHANPVSYLPLSHSNTSNNMVSVKMHAYLLVLVLGQTRLWVWALFCSILNSIKEHWFRRVQSSGYAGFELDFGLFQTQQVLSLDFFFEMV